MNTAAKLSLLGILIGIAGVVGLFVSTNDANYGDRPNTFLELGGDFTLDSVSGPVSLSDYRGKVVVMYFGFLTCPEVCPNSMTVIQGALNRLTNEERETVQALLVSVDPKRDSVEKLEEYTQYYHENLMGLTGTQSDIDAVTRRYGAFYDFTEIEKATSDYGVEHSSRYYVIDQQGKLVAAMRHSTTPNELQAQVRELL